MDETTLKRIFRYLINGTQGDENEIRYDCKRNVNEMIKITGKSKEETFHQEGKKHHTDCP